MPVDVYADFARLDKITDDEVNKDICDTAEEVRALELQLRPVKDTAAAIESAIKRRRALLDFLFGLQEYRRNRSERVATTTE